MSSVPRCITAADIATAADVIAGHALRTPVMTSRQADQIAGAQLFFKCENFQRIGAFKFRGAYNAIAQLSAEQRRAGVIAFHPATTHRRWRWRRANWALAPPS